MRKYLIIMAAALMAVGCAKKPAGEEQQTVATDTVAVEAPAENRYLDITGVTPEGKELSLSDVVGKTDFVLLDFWASWCGPCRRFIPVLKEIHAGMPEGRLQILSCSVDQDKREWLKALEEEQMPWLQMREDEAHPCADKYKLQFIPYTVLIDRKGQIVALDPDEADIETILWGE